MRVFIAMAFKVTYGIAHYSYCIVLYTVQYISILQLIKFQALFKPVILFTSTLRICHCEGLNKAEEAAESESEQKKEEPPTNPDIVLRSVSIQAAEFFLLHRALAVLGCF